MEARIHVLGESVKEGKVEGRREREGMMQGRRKENRKK